MTAIRSILTIMPERPRQVSERIHRAGFPERLIRTANPFYGNTFPRDLAVPFPTFGFVVSYADHEYVMCVDGDHLPGNDIELDRLNAVVRD